MIGSSGSSIALYLSKVRKVVALFSLCGSVACYFKHSDALSDKEIRNKAGFAIVHRPSSIVPPTTPALARRPPKTKRNHWVMSYEFLKDLG